MACFAQKPDCSCNPCKGNSRTHVPCCRGRDRLQLQLAGASENLHKGGPSSRGSCSKMLPGKARPPASLPPGPPETATSSRIWRLPYLLTNSPEPHQKSSGNLSVYKNCLWSLQTKCPLENRFLAELQNAALVRKVLVSVLFSVMQITINGYAYAISFSVTGISNNSQPTNNKEL